jgi:putative polymerase
MSTVWNPAAGSVDESNLVQTPGSLLAPVLVFTAVIFNFVLCFVDTNLFSVSAGAVISCEIVLITTACSLIWYRGAGLHTALLVLAAYFFTVMLVRFEFDPKILRDLLIPFVFFFMGSYLGSVRLCDRLVTILIFLALSAALVEWLALDTFLHYFNVIQYYVARGTETSLQTDTTGGLFIRGTDTAAGLFINGTRFEGRTLLPFLGSHRVSGIFLEPVSVGNFGAIAFAWVLLRDRTRIWILIAKLLAVATVLVLADARFGFYLCIFTLVLYLAAPMIRPTMLFFAPCLIMVALVIYADVNWQELPDNTVAGRLLGAGSSLTEFNLWQVLGFQVSQAFPDGYAGDSGYGYVLVKVGLLGLAAIWALFSFAPTVGKDAWRFKNFIAFYAIFLLSISTSLFSIKTAALLWFLYGTLNNQKRCIWNFAWRMGGGRNARRETNAATFHSPS